MMTRLQVCTLSLVACVVVPTTRVRATLIEFTHRGVGLGSLNDSIYFSGPITFHAVGDTANRTQYGQGYIIGHTSASVTIGNIGTFAILSGTRTFVANENRVVGFSREDEEHVNSGLDLFNGPVSQQFETWDMLSSIGTVYGTGHFLQWDGFLGAVHTSGGILYIRDDNSSAQFTATLLPSPSWLILLPLSIGCMTESRRRQLR